MAQNMTGEKKINKHLMPKPRKKKSTKKSTIWIGEKTPPFESEYERGAKLGSGTYGAAFRARHRESGATYAVKVLDKTPFYRVEESVRERRLRGIMGEIKIMRLLDHPNIVKMTGLYEDKFHMYILMEELKGGELIQRIMQRKQYTEADAAFVMKQVLTALKFMHEVNQIVHCDLKPSNIMFETMEERSNVKLIDFGMSKALPRFHKLSHLVGSPYYVAPEIITERRYDHQCDMWSVGVIIFVMLFGYAPFWADPQKYGSREREEIYKKIKRGFIPEVRKGFGRWFPKHMPVSKEAMHLMANLMKRNVADRYTAQDALNHPWIQRHNISETPRPIPKGMLTTLAKFHNAGQIKIAVCRLFRGQFMQLRPHHFDQLKESFRMMDKDGDGKISFDEFERAITSIQGMPLGAPHIREMFNGLGVDVERRKDGLYFEDLLDACVHDYLVACDERLYQAFTELDEDEDGIITVEQLKQQMKLVNDPLGEESKEKTIELIEQFADNEGNINFLEFLQELHPDYDEVPDWLPLLHKIRSIMPNDSVSTVASEDQKEN